MPLKIIFFALALCLGFGAHAQEATPYAYIISPSHGERVTSPVKVVFGLSGFGVAPSGVTNEKTGHHHLLIDTDLPDLSQPIPKDANHRHFGGGQTEAVIELDKGEHRLQLLLGNFAHIPHAPAVASQAITIIVE